MTFWTRIKSAFQPRVPITLTDTEGWRAISPLSDSGEVVTDSSALALSAVWACTSLISGSIASLPTVVNRRGKDGSFEEAPDHPLYRLLHDSPNADQTSLEFFEYAGIGLELWGNAHAKKIRDSNGRVLALLPLPHGKVQVSRAVNGRLKYKWADENGNALEADEDEILHLRGFGGHPLGGLSTLGFARNAFGLARAIDRSASTTFKNGMRPSGIITFKDWMSAEQRNVVEDKLDQKYTGAMNAGRPMILEGGTEWKPITINPEDAQMLESRRFSVEEICRFFGVPPHMVGHTEKSSSWGTGLEQQTLAFQKFTLRVRMKRIEQALERQLLTPADKARGVSIKFNAEGLLRSDSKARSEFYASALKNGWMTINEVRSKENLPRVDGGDVPRMQMQNVPITEAGNDDA